MNTFIAGIIRHIITTLGGAAAAQGYIGESDVQLIAGSVVTLIGVGMSVWDKYQKRQQ
jgi:hypothetical protein